jgi:transposase, IS605 orfB family
MGKVRTSLSLSKFDVINGNKEKVIEDLMEMIHQIQDAESSFIANPEYQDLAENILSGRVRVSGKKNYCGRGVVPHVVFPCNSYNMNEMLRSSIMSRTETYAVSYGLFAVLVDNPMEIDVRRVKKLFRGRYPNSRIPRYYKISSHIYRFHNKNQQAACLPGSPAKIDLSACDGHYLSLSHKDREITLKFRNLPTAGRQVKLRFAIPEGDRFKGDKISKPVVQIVNNKLVFKFTIEYTVPDITPNKVMGVDLGKVEPFVATITDESLQWHSAPFFATNRIKDLGRKYDELMGRAAHLRNKENRCRASNHSDKADTLARHQRGIRDKARRVKNEAVHQIGLEIAETAYNMNAEVVMENLSWLGSKGGRWNFREIQNAITNSCARKGVPVSFVSARDTSNTCTRCGYSVRHAGRDNVCTSCRFRLNRDVAASREIALRGTDIRLREPLRQRRVGVPVPH